MKRNQKPFWIRHYDQTEDNIAIYTEPEEIYINLYPTNANVDLIALGAEYKEYMRAKISVKLSETFSNGDLIYESVPVFTNIADIGNATYRVTAILPVINVAEILCKRLSGT